MLAKWCLRDKYVDAMMDEGEYHERMNAFNTQISKRNQKMYLYDLRDLT